MSTLEHNSLGEQVNDLREKMRLLQGDRRANIELLEASKTSNREEIQRLRDENKQLRLKLTQAQKGSAIRADCNETDYYQREVHRMRKEADQLKVHSQALKKALDELKDQVRELDLEANKPVRDESPIYSTIRLLENKLDKSMIKYNEAQSIRRTYEQIVRRLKEERLSFDSRLVALERTLQFKKHDFEELLLLSGDANHACEVAQQELLQVKADYEDGRSRREDELRERHQVVQFKRQMRNRTASREKRKQEYIAQAAGDLDTEGEKNLKAALVLNNITSNKFASDKINSKTKLEIFETAFHKIREATGVSDVNEVIRKITAQESTTGILTTLARENQVRLESLQESRKQLKAKVADLNFNGPAAAQHRKMVDDNEEQLANTMNWLERCRFKYERLAKILVSVKSGLTHMQQKLACIRDNGGTQSLPVTDQTLGQVVVENEKVLDMMQQRILSMIEQDTVLAFNEGHSADEGAIEAEVSQSRPYNQRIELPSSFDDDGDAAPSRSAGGQDEEEDLSREKIKKAATQLLQTQERKRKPARLARR